MSCRIPFVLAVLVLLCGCSGGGGGGGTPAPIPTTEWVLNGTHNGLPVTVSANNRFGAAIYSLTWGADQLLDSTDHGRELQTAWTIDSLGEGWNPTEAGSESDGSSYTTSTAILEASSDGTVLKTRTNPAYWRPYNRLLTSPDTLAKTITLGYNNLTNVLVHDISITTQDAHAQLIVEGITAYTPQSMTRYFTLDLAAGTTTELTATFPDNVQTMTQTDKPVILANSDLSVAIGLLCKDTDKKYWIGKVFVWPKIDACWFVVSNPAAGSTYSWRLFTIFGNFQDVINSMKLI